jgi:broad specificity polyphosphatase/5'/3'-nucleotidase SurE
MTSTGCGPIVSGVQIINVNIALSAAETAGAKRAAVFEHTAAKEYLQKAREEHGYSDYWASRIYADKALDYAVRARKKAEATAGTDQTVVLPEGAGTPLNPPAETVLIPTAAP